MARIRVRRTPSRLDYSGAMTDISFLLIVFFLISSVFVADKGVFLKLPKPETPPRVLKPDEVISISIENPGIYRVDGMSAAALDLRELIAEKARMLLDPIAVLTAGDGITYQEVLSVLEEARYAGCTGFSVQSTQNQPLGVKLEVE